MWHLKHAGDVLPGGGYKSYSVDMVHRLIADDPTEAQGCASDIFYHAVECGYLASISITEIAEFLIDWASVPL